MKFENQVAVIAACGSQVGAASALQHLKEGAKVAFYYEDDVRLELFKDLTEEEKSRLLTIRIQDYKDVEELKKAAETVLEKFRTCDIVVTAITTDVRESGYSMSEEEYDRVMKTITNGALYTIQPLMPAMKEKSMAVSY